MTPTATSEAPTRGSARSRSGGLVAPEKVQPWHWQRLAVVYVRQSTPQQVLDHQESTRLQYGLTERAVELGWAAAQVVVIDDDQGKSGTSVAGRPGFQRLVADVSLDRVGLILGVQMSRLARSCAAWYQLLEVCAGFSTLLADLDGVYDPTQFNDRLLLGLKELCRRRSSTSWLAACRAPSVPRLNVVNYAFRYRSATCAMPTATPSSTPIKR
jgi:Resolvase, N terminal domain